MKLPVIYIETFNKALNSLEIDSLWNLMGYVHNFPSIATLSCIPVFPFTCP